MPALTMTIEGIGFWAPGLPDWPAVCALLNGDPDRPGDSPNRPAATSLSPADRRRAPDSVLLACEVAAQAAAMARRDPATLTSVFVSTQGDLAITDYLCRTLAANPHELSPTRFHNSVHNAPAGYWTIASGCHAPSTAISAWNASFAAGLLEAATQALCERTPVLLVAYDTAACGPLIGVSPGSVLFGAALVVAPEPGAHALAGLSLWFDPAAPLPTGPPACLCGLAAANPMAAGGMALLAALAADRSSRVTLAGAAGPALAIEVTR
ncbi:MAG TPA: beta-ketoacyl synthase chain length factor [Rhodanobacteraceae bacterium]|nr:beta-ketoacyl synthase chain length factor [Rhodanobacteraceae bacterium]